MLHALETATTAAGLPVRSPGRCLWMLCGVLDYRLCDRDYDCEHCDLDRALRGTRPRADGVATPAADHQPDAETTRDDPRLPSGLFFHPLHAWARIEDGGRIRCGVDELLCRGLGRVYFVALPRPGTAVRRGKPCGRIVHQSGETALISPVTGLVCAVNARLVSRPSLLSTDPYGQGWAVLVEPTELGRCLKALMYGSAATGWMRREIDALASSAHTEGVRTPAGPSSARPATAEVAASEPPAEAGAKVR